MFLDPLYQSLKLIFFPSSFFLRTAIRHGFQDAAVAPLPLHHGRKRGASQIDDGEGGGGKKRRRTTGDAADVCYYHVHYFVFTLLCSCIFNARVQMAPPESPWEAIRDEYGFDDEPETCSYGRLYSKGGVTYLRPTSMVTLAHEDLKELQKFVPDKAVDVQKCGVALARACRRFCKMLRNSLDQPADFLLLTSENEFSHPLMLYMPLACSLKIQPFFKVP